MTMHTNEKDLEVFMLEAFMDTYKRVIAEVANAALAAVVAGYPQVIAAIQQAIAPISRKIASGCLVRSYDAREVARRAVAGSWNDDKKMAEPEIIKASRFVM